ncbi:cysteine hydrolase family protein [Micromonospora carbonacea]|uniref:cysteine hydrolase family protein n=1 Tax=Micromonospora carbonacea TaxID=47853 RepID=UPI0033E312BE
MYSTQAALIVIDMQNGFISDQSPYVIPKFVELVERWEATDRPVVFTRYHDYPSSPFERLIDWSKVQRWMPSVDLGSFRPLWGPFRTKIAELPFVGAGFYRLVPSVYSAQISSRILRELAAASPSSSSFA